MYKINIYYKDNDGCLSKYSLDWPEKDTLTSDDVEYHRQQVLRTTPVGKLKNKSPVLALIYNSTI